MVRLLLLVLAGLCGGMLLGNLATGSGRSGTLSDRPPFSSLSSNPDAALPPPAGADPCLGCPDSYGVAARLRADREERMGGTFRELGYVDPDGIAPDDEEDVYRYGGRFPDPATATAPAKFSNELPAPAEPASLPAIAAPQVGADK
jgi:hypothetical protein